MLKKGIMAGSLFCACTEHHKDIVMEYLDGLYPILCLIRECEDGRPVRDLLDGPVCHSGFKRLN